MPFKVSFIFPSMSRPVKFFNVLENLKEMCGTENYEVIAVLDETDLTMNNQPVIDRMGQYSFLKPFFINSTGKIDAINKGLQFLSEDYEIACLIADDIFFTLKNFDWHFVTDMQLYFPGLDGCLYYPDGKVGDRQITMPVLGKELIEKFGYIYHDSYISLWADNEMLAVYKSIGKVKYMNTDLFVHNHPAWGKGENDDLYRRNESFYQQDSDNYFKRLSENFDL